jgi:glycosyltransferase involved in cell wall biosynthesis
MRFLILSNCPLIASQGSGYVIINVAQELRKRGHSVDLVGPEVLDFFSFLRKGKCLRLALGMLWYVLKKVFFSRNCYDVVQFCGGEAWLATACLKFLNVSALIIQYSNGIEPHHTDQLKRHTGYATLDGAKPKWYQGLWRPPVGWSFQQCDGLVLVSEFDADYAKQQHYQSSDKILVLPNAIDDWLNLKPNFQRERQLGYVGRWAVTKGEHLLLPAVIKLLNSYPDYRFFFIGVGEDFDKKKYFPPALLERIDVVPFVENKEVLMRHYKKLAALLVPSLYESFGLVIAEALACGCPVVANPVGFATMLKEDEEVILMKEWTVEGLFVACQRLIEDEGLRQVVAQRGYERVQSLRWATNADLYLDALKRWGK